VSTAVLRGVGGCLPAWRVTNADLAASHGLAPDWVESRTGIRARHRVVDGTATSDLAVTAARHALQSAGLAEVDMILVATTTPDFRCPATAPVVAARLGLTAVAAMDVAAVCAGFVYGLAHGVAAIRSGLADRVLVVGADTFSVLLDPEDGVNQAIFGDGAGAVVLDSGQPGEPGEIHGAVLGSDGGGERMVWVPAGGSRPPALESPYFRMAGREVFQAAVTAMTAASREAVALSGWTVDDIRWVVPHQANLRILHQVMVGLGLPVDRGVVHLDRVGNTSAASIPLALSAHQDQFAPGDRMLLTAFGGGLAWGAVALSWPEHLVRVPIRCVAPTPTPTPTPTPKERTS
jgi:3-oxoacyl-[acyl-carrier-protein] synthase III